MLIQASIKPADLNKFKVIKNNIKKQNRVLHSLKKKINRLEKKLNSGNKRYIDLVTVTNSLGCPVHIHCHNHSGHIHIYGHIATACCVA